MRLRVNAAAEAELQASANWYEARLKGLGERFLSEIIDAFTDIERHPSRFPQLPYRTHREIRRRLLRHFPFAIIYEIKSEGVEVVAVAHTKRRPGYWRERL